MKKVSKIGARIRRKAKSAERKVKGALAKAGIPKAKINSTASMLKKRVRAAATKQIAKGKRKAIARLSA